VISFPFRMALVLWCGRHLGCHFIRKKGPRSRVSLIQAYVCQDRSSSKIRGNQLQTTGSLELQFQKERGGNYASKRHPYGPTTQSPCTVTPDRGLSQPPNKGQGLGLSLIKKDQGKKNPSLALFYPLLKLYLLPALVLGPEQTPRPPESDDRAKETQKQTCRTESIHATLQYRY
jgi:hypothetical protein